MVKQREVQEFSDDVERVDRAAGGWWKHAQEELKEKNHKNRPHQQYLN